MFVTVKDGDPISRDPIIPIWQIPPREKCSVLGALLRVFLAIQINIIIQIITLFYLSQNANYNYLLHDSNFSLRKNSHDISPFYKFYKFFFLFFCLYYNNYKYISIITYFKIVAKQYKCIIEHIVKTNQIR